MARPRKSVRWKWNGSSLVLIKDGVYVHSIGEKKLYQYFVSDKANKEK